MVMETFNALRRQKCQHGFRYYPYYGKDGTTLDSRIVTWKTRCEQDCCKKVFNTNRTHDIICDFSSTNECDEKCGRYWVSDNHEDAVKAAQEAIEAANYAPYSDTCKHAFDDALIAISAASESASVSTRSEVEKLTVMLNELMSDDNNCAVCYGPLLAKTECGHLLCKKCHLLMNLRKEYRCPICRRRLPPDSMAPDEEDR